ncbi:MAG: ABC transporter ATP-binding protein [Gemmatimonadales bacterium]|nr:ABC transporter ATP-binding protein [Gemmatimonadales bacterium]
MTAPIAVRLDAVSKEYPGPVPVRALTDVTLRIAAGALTVVEGPSGSGKSTLLALVGGLDRPSAGAIEVFGLSLSGLPERRLRTYRRNHVGFVFQDFKLLDVLSALDNVALVLELRGVARREARRRSAALLDELGMDGRAKAHPGDLSGGEKQRTAIARALVAGAQLILADEPTANLDSAAGIAVVDVLHAATRTRGATAIVVSHDPRVAACADHVFRLADGRVVPPAEEVLS